MNTQSFTDEWREGYVSKVAHQVTTGMVTYEQGVTLLREIGMDDDEIDAILVNHVARQTAAPNVTSLH